ncbi:hypothetical protein GCM10027346_18440 [Hymenobacter seoulensis]
MAGNVLAGSVGKLAPAPCFAKLDGASIGSVAYGPQVAVRTPAQGLGTGLTASYFTNGTLAGAPALSRVDAAVDFRWGKGAPAPGIPADNFSVRWEGLLAGPSTGRYRFSVVTPDEVRVWVNGKKVVDTWDGKKASATDASVNLAAGEKTTIKIEYSDTDGDATVQLMWVAPGQGPQVIPMGSLYPVGSPTTPDPAGATPAVAAKPATPAPAPAKPATPAPAPAPVVAAKPVKAAKPSKKTADKPAEATASVPAQAPAPVAAKPASAKPAPAAAQAPAATALTGGIFTLTNRATGKALEVDMGRPATRAEQLAMAGNAAAPQWKIESVADGYYRLMVQGSNKVLEVLGSSTSNGADLSLWTYYSGYNQLWRIEDVGDGYYKLTAKHSRKALTQKDSIDGGFQQWRYNGKENQHWKLAAVAPVAAAPMAAFTNLRGVGANNMSVYPNPSNGVIQMAYELKQEQPLGWVLYSQRGVAVRVSDYRKQAAGPHNQTLDFTDLPAGDYYLNLTVGAENTRQLISIRRPSADVPEVGASK